MRTRAERRHFRQTKKMRRLKEDWNQHSRDGYMPAKYFSDRWVQSGGPVNTKFHCPCFYDPKAQAMFADTPNRGRMTQNPRRHPMEKGERLTMQERRAPTIEEYNA